MAQKLVKCPGCGAVNPEHSTFCSSCGISTGASTAPSLGRLGAERASVIAAASQRNAPQLLFPPTTKPVIGGTLAIVGGGVNLLIFTLAIISLTDPPSSVTGSFYSKLALSIICGLVALVGGTFAISRRHFNVAILAAFCSMYPALVPGVIFLAMGLLCGLGSLALLAISQKEFVQQEYLSSRKAGSN